MDQGFSLSEMNRRLANLIRLGSVAEADYEKARVKIKIGPITTEWLPWITSNASHNRNWNAPEIGEQVLVLSPSGEMSQAAVIRGIYQQKHSAPETNIDKQSMEFKDGTTIHYDRSNHHFTLNVTQAGSIALKVGDSTIEINKDTIVLKANKIELN